MVDRRALVVGIDSYDNLSDLTCACRDAQAMAELLSRNDDESINYVVRMLVSTNGERVTRVTLRQAWLDLFEDFESDAVFYFSGHGAQTPWGGYLVTQEGSDRELGVSMEDLLVLTNKSRAKDVVLILDCCHSGDLGNPPILQSLEEHLSLLKEGVTILAASRPNAAAYELDEHGMFTYALLEGLKGGAVDLMGNVNPASLFLYAERLFDAWDQHPIYKSHTRDVSSLRSCTPPVEQRDLRAMPEFFPEPDAQFALDPEYESEEEPAEGDPERAKKREDSRLFKRLRDARLIESVEGEDLYWTAMNSRSVRLTALGRYYCRLLNLGKL